MSKPFNPTICVDFDGVIHSYTSGWKGAHIIPDVPVPGAIEWLESHLPTPDSLCAMAPPHEGPIVQIYSSRSKSWRGRRAMKNWLIKHGMHPGYIREGILKFPTKKPAAFLTLDDRAICFDGKFPTKEEMLAFVPWYRRTAQEGDWYCRDCGYLDPSRVTHSETCDECHQPVEWHSAQMTTALEEEAERVSRFLKFVTAVQDGQDIGERFEELSEWAETEFNLGPCPECGRYSPHSHFTE